MRGLHRPQPATVLATLALFVALGGTSYAIGNQINGSQLKNRSIAGNKLKKHAVNGTDVNVTSFPKVPSAHTADLATNAANATNAKTATAAGTITGTITGSQVSSAVANATSAANVGGHTLVDIDSSCSDTGTGNCSIFPLRILNDLDGLSLLLMCVDTTNVEIFADTADNGASMGMDEVGQSATESANDQGNFDTSGNMVIGAVSNGQVDFAYSHTAFSLGTITTHVVSGTLTIQDDDGTCSAFGNVDGFLGTGRITL